MDNYSSPIKNFVPPISLETEPDPEHKAAESVETNTTKYTKTMSPVNGGQRSPYPFMKATSVMGADRFKISQSYVHSHVDNAEDSSSSPEVSPTSTASSYYANEYDIEFDEKLDPEIFGSRDDMVMVIMNDPPVTVKDIETKEIEEISKEYEKENVEIDTSDEEIERIEKVPEVDVERVPDQRETSEDFNYALAYWRQLENTSLEMKAAEIKQRRERKPMGYKANPDNIDHTLSSVASSEIYHDKPYSSKKIEEDIIEEDPETPVAHQAREALKEINDINKRVMVVEKEGFPVKAEIFGDNGDEMFDKDQDPYFMTDDEEEDYIDDLETPKAEADNAKFHEYAECEYPVEADGNGIHEPMSPVSDSSDFSSPMSAGTIDEFPFSRYPRTVIYRDLVNGRHHDAANGQLPTIIVQPPSEADSMSYRSLHSLDQIAPEQLAEEYMVQNMPKVPEQLKQVQPEPSNRGIIPLFAGALKQASPNEESSFSPSSHLNFLKEINFNGLQPLDPLTLADNRSIFDTKLPEMPEEEESHWSSYLLFPFLAVFGRAPGQSRFLKSSKEGAAQTLLSSVTTTPEEQLEAEMRRQKLLWNVFGILLTGILLGGVVAGVLIYYFGRGGDPGVLA
ncbi:hypothetical protein V1511DRAFT_512113 [Dipodascopsis uninucleata]